MIVRHRKLLNAIEREFTQLGFCWVLFHQLFDSGQDKVDLLNKSGSNVFVLFQKLIIDEVIMSLCRLTDPPKSMGNENASLRNLVDKLRGKLLLKSENKIDAKLIELSKHLKKARVLRNKAGSHTDLAYALNIKSLPQPTYDELEGAIDAATSILNEITGKVFDYSEDYKPHIAFGHDGNKLLSVLAKAHLKKTGPE